MQSLPLSDNVLRERLRLWLVEQPDGDTKIVLRANHGAVIRADYSRVLRFRIRDLARAPDEIMHLVRSRCPRFGSIVIHARGGEVEIEVSDSLVRVV